MNNEIPATIGGTGRAGVTMHKHFWPIGAVLMAMAPLHAQDVLRRAIIVGGGSYGGGKCTIQVNVDHSAEVEIWGDNAELRTTAGARGFWRRFECTAPMPRYADNFRLVPIEGRGPVSLLQDSRNNRGRALVRINDPRPGRGSYSFDIQWRGSGWQGWTPRPPQGQPPGPWKPPAHTVAACQDAVTDRLNHYGYPDATFGRIDGNAGRNGWVTGMVTGQRRSRTAVFTYSCSVDIRSSRVRSVDVQPQERF